MLFSMFLLISSMLLGATFSINAMVTLVLKNMPTLARWAITMTINLFMIFAPLFGGNVITWRS